MSGHVFACRECAQPVGKPHQLTCPIREDGDPERFWVMGKHHNRMLVASRQSRAWAGPVDDTVLVEVTGPTGRVTSHRWRPPGSKADRAKQLRAFQVSAAPAPKVDRKAVPAGVRAVAYTRVSTEQQGASGAGLDAQESACRQLADREGLTLAAVFTDVRSGSTRKGRKGLADAIAALEKGDTLVVAKLDRLARNVWEFGDIVREVDRKGARILVGDAPISDMSSPAGRAFVQMLAVFADFERGMAQARTLEAVAVKRAQGKDLGGRRKGCYLVPPETRARVRALRSRGWTLRRIAEHLNDEGVPAGRGGRWHPESVRLVCR